MKFIALVVSIVLITDISYAANDTDSYTTQNTITATNSSVDYPQTSTDIPKITTISTSTTHPSTSSTIDSSTSTIPDTTTTTIQYSSTTPKPHKLTTVVALLSTPSSAVNFDREATFMALEKASALLEPPKELFQQIHSDLAVIRSSFANVSDIRYVSNWVPGKLLCNGINDRAVKKLNLSDFGPVKEDRTDHYTALTFSKPYNTPVLINKLKENGLLEDSYDCRVDGIIDGKSNIIYNYDKTYTFHKNLGDCGITCADKYYWTFEVKNGSAVLIKESKT